MAAANKVVRLCEHKEKVMGKPQTEDGYTRIANELLEAIISYDFSSRHLKVIFAIIRKTYGFNKKSDEIGLSQIRDITGIDRGNASRIVNQLTEMKVLIVAEGNNARTISLNKNYKEWVLPNKQQESCQSSNTCQISNSCQTDNQSVANLTIKVLPNRQPQYTYTKDNTKDIGFEAPQAALNDGDSPSKKARKTGTQKTFSQWIDDAKAKGEKAVSDYKPVWDYAAESGLPKEFIEIAWLDFKDRYTKGTGSKKKYIDWRAAFRDHVKGNYQKLWFFSEKDNQYRLTTAGIQADKVWVAK